VVEAAVIADLVEGSDGSGFGVACSVDHAAQAGVDDEPAAHGAGFEGDDEGAVVESPVVDVFAGVEDGGELGVAGGIFITLSGVGALTEDFPGLGFVDHGSNRNLTAIGGFLSEGQGVGHHLEIDLGRLIRLIGLVDLIGH